ncbi:lysylphosphatidylglycerol synthase transmembrane domain-containing protein [Culicoidibacter larvae]|uniref:lysylphosphatidylglycerol synthase transmembrane domain-containing protein n=1 Tax=Culicoidibacter larvae TaxID=2579976 RepID=UPI001485A62A|nr:lysylphosphatidylglycerol synthase transmembrane domain-containing protein [Culicoidibacter larvae]
MKKKSIFKNSTFWSLVFVAVITGITVWYVLKDDTAEKLLQLQQVNLLWVAAAMSLVVFWWFAEAVVIKRIGKIQGVKYRYMDAVFATIIGQFYSLATPAATGGDFLQTYYMNKQGVKLSSAISMVTVNLILYVASLLAMSFVSALISYPFFSSYVPGLDAFLVIGFGSTLLVYVTMLTCALSEKLHGVIIGLLSTILKKINAEKSEKWIVNISLGIGEFREGIQLIGKHRMAHFKIFLFNCGRMIIFNFLPIFVALAFGMELNIWMWIYATCGSILIALITSFIPIPGATGGSEVLFTLIYSFIFSSDALGPGLLLWRSGQFYFTIIVGGLVTVIYSLYIRRKSSNSEVVEELEAIE